MFYDLVVRVYRVAQLLGIRFTGQQHHQFVTATFEDEATQRCRFVVDA